MTSVPSIINETTERILNAYSKDKSEIAREINCLQEQINDVFTLCQKIANVVNVSHGESVRKSAFTPWGKKYSIGDEVASKYVIPGVIKCEEDDTVVEADTLKTFDVLKRLGKIFRESGIVKVNEEIFLIVEELDQAKLLSHKSVAKILTTKLVAAEKYEYLSNYRDLQFIWENMIQEKINGNIAGLVILAFCGLRINNESVRLDAPLRKKLRKFLNDGQNRDRVRDSLSKTITAYQKWFLELKGKNPKKIMNPRSVVCSDGELDLANMDPLVVSTSLMEFL